MFELKAVWRRGIAHRSDTSLFAAEQSSAFARFATYFRRAVAIGFAAQEAPPTASLVRSSAAEYLTFVAASGEGGVEAVYADENVWLSQKMMAQLYDVEIPTINYHLKKVFEDSELEEDSVIRSFRITAADSKTYDTKHYNLSAIIAVGYKVNSERALQFRKWATRVVEEFTVKGFAMDDERLKRGGSVLSDRYFEEQLQRVREIRLSERKFYQKITDIYATSVDYDMTAQATKRFPCRSCPPMDRRQGRRTKQTTAVESCMIARSSPRRFRG